jgi:3-oxoadipate enol-lactonase
VDQPRAFYRVWRVAPTLTITHAEMDRLLEIIEAAIRTVGGWGGSTMAFMEKNGFRLYYEDTGGTAPTVLFLHGAGGNHLSWWQQVPVFAEEYRCVTVDQRGFGQSPDVAGGPGPAALATDAIALLDHLGIGQAAVVAQSMGGWAAVGAAVRAPERFWAVVMANTVGNLTNPEIASVRQRLAAASPPRPAVLWHAALGETFRKVQPVRAFLYAQIAGTNAPLAADFRDQLGRLTTPVERYAATRVPTLFLTSDEDGLIWPELSKKVHEQVPGSRFERVEAAGHSTYFERPDVFNREVGAFLKEHRP